MNLLDIKTFVVPSELASGSVTIMQRAAREGNEIFIALAGRREGDRFIFRRGIVPRQTCHHTSRGLLVTIDGDALFELNRDAHSQNELLAGQIHAHPDSAYHSQADDELALVTVAGGLSLVVPDFARGGLDGVSRWACFQLQPDAAWKPLGSQTRVVIR